MASIDTSIHPHASGAAARLAAAHGAEHPLKLYGGWFCPFVQRAWIVLVEKAIPHQYVETNPYRKAPELLALNPRGLVPALSVPLSPSSSSRDSSGSGGSKPLYESAVICEFLDEAFADEATYGPRLLPAGAGLADAYERARCRLWMDHVASRVVPAFYRLLQHTPDKPYGLAEARAGLHAHLRSFAAEMLLYSSSSVSGEGSGGPYFLGARFSLVDVMLAPWAMRLFLIDHYKPGGVGIPPAGRRGSEEDEKVWARWDAWFDAVTQRESVRATWSSEEQYVDVYRRYAEDTTQSEVGKATRQGGTLP